MLMSGGRFILSDIFIFAASAALCFCEDITPYHTGSMGVLTMAECLSCHDGMTGTEIKVCLGTECLYTNDHSIMDLYPPLDNQLKFAAQSDLELAGGMLENGKTTCLSCHNMANPSPHLIKPRQRDQLCLVCHISQKSL